MTHRPIINRTVRIERRGCTRGKRVTHVEVAFVGTPVPPTPEQLADRFGRDDGIRTIRPEVVARLHRFRMFLLEKRYGCHRTPGNSGQPLQWVEKGITYPTVCDAARAIGTHTDAIYRMLRGEDVKQLKGITLRRV